VTRVLIGFDGSEAARASIVAAAALFPDAETLVARAGVKWLRRSLTTARPRPGAPAAATGKRC
jgi:hypothetical protein